MRTKKTTMDDMLAPNISEIRADMFREYRETREINTIHGRCVFVGGKFVIGNYYNSAIIKFDTLDEAVNFMV